MAQRLFVVASDERGLSDAYRAIPYLSVAEIAARKAGENWFAIQSEKPKQEIEAAEVGRRILLLPDDVLAYWKSLSRLPQGTVLRLLHDWATSFSSSFSRSLPPSPPRPVPSLLTPAPQSTPQQETRKIAAPEQVQQGEMRREKEKGLGKRGTVYVASFKKGVKQPDPPPGAIRINVTSGSMNKIDGHLATQLSPMYLGPVKGAKIFENYYQYSKIFRELGHLNPDGTTTERWEQFRRKGFAKETGDRHPEGTKTDRILHVETSASGQTRNFYEYLKPVSSKYDGKIYDYIGSRKAVYVPEYAKLAEQTPFFKALKRQVDDGQSVLILDFDGPRDGIMEVTVPNLVAKINDPSAPFGHGFVVAALLAGIAPSEYTK